MANYELHEFDPVKVFTGEINPLEVNSFMYEAYDTNTLGQIVIDKNNLTDIKRKFISLATKKTSYEKFNQVVDVEFAEFILNNAAAPVDFLQAKIDSLEADKEILKSNRNADRQQIESLIRQIEALQAQLDALKNPAFVNKISNVLKPGQKLIAGNVGSNGLPTDRLLSKNRKYIAQIQGDRNFVVKKGEFDENGNPLEDTVVELVRTIQAARGVSLYSTTSGPYVLQFSDRGEESGRILEIGLSNTGDPEDLNNSEVIAYPDGGFNTDGRLILEDSGRLAATNNSQVVRSF